jgi:hypothetical protein
MSQENSSWQRGIPFADRAPTASDNPFAFPENRPYDGWTTRSDGAMERGGGPLVLRVEVNTEAAGSGYRWKVLCHSWVEPALAELDRGSAKSLSVAKAQCFWSAYAYVQTWLRGLGDGV